MQAVFGCVFTYEFSMLRACVKQTASSTIAQGHAPAQSFVWSSGLRQLERADLIHRRVLPHRRGNEFLSLPRVATAIGLGIVRMRPRSEHCGTGRGCPVSSFQEDLSQSRILCTAVIMSIHILGYLQRCCGGHELLCGVRSDLRASDGYRTTDVPLLRRSSAQLRGHSSGKIESI